MSISSFFGLLLLLSLPLSPALTPYFVYFFDLILFTIFLFFWPPFSAWIYHSPLKGEWFLLRSPPLLFAVRHSRRVPPSPSSLSLPFPRSFPPLPRFSPLFFVWSKAPPSPSFLLLLFLALTLRFPLSWSILFFVIVVVPQYLFSFVVWAPDFSCHFSDTPSHSHAKRRSWLSTISFYMDEKSVDSFSSSLASPFPPPFSWVLYLCICIEILYCIFTQCFLRWFDKLVSFLKVLFTSDFSFIIGCVMFYFLFLSSFFFILSYRSFFVPHLPLGESFVVDARLFFRRPCLYSNVAMLSPSLLRTLSRHGFLFLSFFIYSSQYFPSILYISLLWLRLPRDSFPHRF